MKKLAIITALHERYRLTSIFLHYYAHVLNVPGVIVHLLCAVTTNEYKMRDLLSNYLQWERVYTVNSPLTYKFAANMEGVKKFNPDAMLILGSDDFVDADFIYEGLEKCEETGFAGTNEVHYLDYGTESMIRQWSIDGRPVGAGRFLSKRLLKELDWMPWDMDNTKLDNSMLSRVEVPCTFMERGTLLDVKMKDNYGNETNQTPYSTVRSWPHQQVDARKYIKRNFPELEQMLLV